MINGAPAPSPSNAPSLPDVVAFVERYHRAMQSKRMDLEAQKSIEQSYGASALAMLDLLASQTALSPEIGGESSRDLLGRVDAATEAGTTTPTAPETAPMTAEHYQAWVGANWARRTIASDAPLADLFVMCTGWSGETGEALEIIKKSIRDGARIEGKTRLKLTLEMGDALHYLTRIASYYGLSLGDIMRANQQKIDARARRREAAHEREKHALEAADAR